MGESEDADPAKVRSVIRGCGEFGINHLALVDFDDELDLERESGGQRAHANGQPGVSTMSGHGRQSRNGQTRRPVRMERLAGTVAIASG